MDTVTALLFSSRRGERKAAELSYLFRKLEHFRLNTRSSKSCDPQPARLMPHTDGAAHRERALREVHTLCVRGAPMDNSVLLALGQVSFFAQPLH